MKPNPRMMRLHHLCFAAIGIAVCASIAGAKAPPIDSSVVFGENDDVIAVEAEHFFRQSKDGTRAWYLTHSESTSGPTPDGDPSHVAGASGGAYLEILPDTRRTHADKLIRGTNFAPEAGEMAVLEYKVHIDTPGTYYVWVRAHSTGSEDNGLHVGIDGDWPASGQRLQWCEGKKTWRWESKQRTEKQHCGEPNKIFLEIDKPGEHIIQFSMREDGFEFDKWFMTRERGAERPEGVGPKSVVKNGAIPAAFPMVAAKPMPQESSPQSQPSRGGAARLEMTAESFSGGDQKGFYLDRGKWMAINPDKNREASCRRTFPFPTGKYNLVLMTVGENDGRSSYSVSVDSEKVGDYQNPLGEQMFEEGSKFHKRWPGVSITEGAMIGVDAKVGSKDGAEFSRARWVGVVFEPADDATRKAVAPVLKRLASQKNATPQIAGKTSPTKPSSDLPLQQPRQQDGNGKVKVSGELQTWHKITLDLAGPYAHEKDNRPNPFTDYRMSVEFKHADGKSYLIPGYFAADGNAANSSAESGTVWRANFAPDRVGTWSYTVRFRQGQLVALGGNNGQSLAPFDGVSGKFEVAPSDKSGRDLRAQGRLQYVGKHYLQFAGSKRYFLKVGADAPETLLAYADFDNTLAGNPKKAPIKTWSPHLRDWQSGDPTWGDDKGKALIGAVNYLSGKGCNAFSFLTYNAGGDGDNVWPFIAREDKLHYDCSKLDQWGVVFDHGTAKGMYLHFKLQETENDDHRRNKGTAGVPESLDGGNLGPQRMLYCREMIARYGHNLALNWNLGEENTQSTEQQIAMIDYIAETDSYDHNIVIHTYPSEQDKVYNALLGDRSKLTGASLQNSSLETTHAHTSKWVRASAAAGRPWVVAFDESGSAAHAQCPDLGYKGFDGRDRSGKMAYTQHKVRKQTLWGTLMAGGAGNEYYFGYQFAENDIVCEDWRSRDQSWDYCRIAISFFHDHNIPFWEMENVDKLVGNPEQKPTEFCFAKTGELYLVYLCEGGEAELDLSQIKGEFDLQWFNPRSGGSLLKGTKSSVTGGSKVGLGKAPEDPDEDWLVVVKKKDLK